jgi:hypothetical protein
MTPKFVDFFLDIRMAPMYLEQMKHLEAAVESGPTAPAAEAAEAGIEGMMRQKLASATGQVLCAARKRIIEPKTSSDTGLSVPHARRDAVARSR